MNGYSTLNFNNRDEGYKFRRPNWDNNLYFAWNPNLERYQYIHGGFVGDGVLQAQDLMKFNLKKKKKETK